jgi:hypothetical protein
MPVEIRELIIKTEITSNRNQSPHAFNEKSMEKLKEQLLEECKRIIDIAAKKNINKR